MRQETRCGNSTIVRNRSLRAPLSGSALGFVRLRLGLAGASAENVIPERRTYSITVVIILVVMAQVMSLEPKPNPAAHREMVGRVMQGIVEQIARQQAGKERRGVTSEENQEQTVEKERERDAYHRRHHQPA